MEASDHDDYDFIVVSSQDESATEEVQQTTNVVVKQELSQSSRKFSIDVDDFILSRYSLSNRKQPKPSDFGPGIDGKTNKQLVDRWRTMKRQKK